MKASEVMKVLENNGWFEVRKRGSHRIFKHNKNPSVVSVPDHGKKDVAPGTLNDILKTAGLK